MDRKSLEVSVFFPSASRVKIPFVGDDTRHIKPFRPNLNPTANPLRKHQENVGNSLIKQISKEFDFGHDVMKERCAYVLPYDEKEVLKAYDFSDVISHSTTSTKPGGRFDVRGYLRKVPCQVKKFAEPRAARMIQKPKTVTERHGEIPPSIMDVTKSEKFKSPRSKESHIRRRTFLNDALASPRSDFSTTNNKTELYQLHKNKSSAQWDEYVINKLSKDCARWIVYQNTESGLQKDRLDRLVRKKFGAKVSNTNLVRENAKDSDFKAMERKKEEKQKELLEEQKRAKKQEHIMKLQKDPILKQTFAQYYKLPKFLKQQQFEMDNVENDVNQTAQNIQVKHLELPPPPKMRDYLNPAAGKYINATENAFEQQLYTNQAKPIFRMNDDKGRIIMSDLSEYQSNVQTMYPPQHSQWSEGNDVQKKDVRKVNIIRGMRRWKALPNPADFASERGLNLPVSGETKVEDHGPVKAATMLNNAPMIHIIEEWRSKWKLAGRWQEVSLADVILDMDNIHAHVRLGAVAACAMAALYKIPVEDMAALAVLPKIDSNVLSNNSDVGHLFNPLLEKVRSRLKDSNERVKLAAAMCLYTLSESNEKVLQILEHNLDHGVPADRMACAQCLALHGSTDSRVVHLIIQMLLETDQEEQATALLVHLSQYTKLVHSLLAEQLNSSCWKDKVIACDVLSQLSGNINRDLVHKFTNLMWNDWSSEVRKAASRALGRTGHGRDVHFELREKLMRGNERVCTDVLRKIAHLGIMTATLLPEYLKCFSAEYTSVRMESVRVAAKLKLADEKVIAELVRLTQYDPAWKIKAYAIKALGEIGVTSDKIQFALVWALRFEEEPGVRMEACVALRKLNCNTTEVVHVLQDRVLVEPVAAVKEEVRAALDYFGMSGPEDNMEMILQIKSEVKKLCRKSVVAAKVIMYERELEKFERQAEYIGNMIDDLSTNGGSDVNEEDDIDLEIANACQRPKSIVDDLRQGSSSRSVATTSRNRLTSTGTADSPREKTPAVAQNNFTPSTG